MSAYLRASLCLPPNMTPTEHLLPDLLIYYPIPYYLFLLIALHLPHMYKQTLSVRVIPGHPVTGVMTITTNLTPASIPMALISRLASMRCD